MSKPEKLSQTENTPISLYTRVRQRVMRSLLGVTLVTTSVLAGGRIAAEAQYYASGVYDKNTNSTSFEPHWSATQDTHLPMRDPLVVVTDMSYVEQADSLEKSYSFLTDEAGFQIVSRPPNIIRTDAYPVDRQPTVSELAQSVEQPMGSPGYTIHVGDSYLQTLPSQGYRNNAQWQDAWAVSGAGPRDYLEAVRHRFDDITENQQLLNYLKSLPEGSPLTVALYITPHNDLEGMVGAPLFTEKTDARPESVQHEHIPANSREWLRFTRFLWGPWLGVDSYEKEKSLRSLLDTTYLGSQLTGNPADLQPSLADSRVQAFVQSAADSLRNLSVQFPSLAVSMEVVVFPSYYGGSGLESSWDGVVQALDAQAKILGPPTPVQEYDLYGFTRTYLALKGEANSVLFQSEDQHFNTRGIAVESISLQWIREGKELNETTLNVFDQEAENFSTHQVGRNAYE